MDFIWLPVGDSDLTASGADAGLTTLLGRQALQCLWRDLGLHAPAAFGRQPGCYGTLVRLAAQRTV